ncbi:MAG: hypothetical protein JW993_00855 [Sedimentisphaerales bacterium]|nr:hypothetical protein [Sedimentisphaerales bacterium]
MRQGRQHIIEKWEVVVAAAVVLAVLIVSYIALPRHRLNQRLDVLRAAGYPTSFAELAQYNRLADGTPNAAPVYEQAFAAFVPPVDEVNVPFLGNAKLPARGAVFSEPVAKAAWQCLTANQNCLSLLHEAAGIEDCRYGWDYTDLVNGVPPWESVKRCARLLRLRTAVDVYAGDSASALTHIKDQLQLGRSLCREPGVVNYLFRIACYGIALEGLEQTLSAVALSDPQLMSLSETISSAKATLDFVQAVVTERCFMIELVRYPARHSPPGPAGGFLQLLSDRGLADVLDYASASIEAAKLPSAQRLAKFRQIADRVDERFSSLHLDLLGTAAMTPMDRAAGLDVRMWAQSDMARTALAIERYRLAAGNVPERLEELVPQYLKEVPVDPFDSQAIRYKRADPGYQLYSILEDGQDNDGTAKTEVNSGEPYDLPFQVTR